MGISLRHFHHIKDDELVIVATAFGVVQKCDCMSCAFRSFDFHAFTDRLKQGEQSQSIDTLDLAYGHYLISTDNFKKSYFLYRNVDINTKGRENKNTLLSLKDQSIVSLQFGCQWR